MSIVGIKTQLQKNRCGRFLLQVYHYVYAVPASKIYPIKYHFIKRNFKHISFYSYDDTFDKLINEKKSLCRFGDGEIAWIYKSARGYFGQENSGELSDSLKKVILSYDDRILIGVPDFFGDMKGYSKKRKKSRSVHLAQYGDKWMRLLDDNRIYVDALITRVYLGRTDIDYEHTFNQWKRVWDKRDVVIVEGAETRFGIGNDLLDNAMSVSRVIAPAENAFSKYATIASTVKKYPKGVLFLIALGPTATVMAYDLAKEGFQAIDIGHLDIEYEWFRAKSEKKECVKGKYVNEAGGMPQEELDENNLHVYEEQIQFRCD